MKFPTENLADCRLPTLGMPRLPPNVSESCERKTHPRNTHTAGSSSSCVGDTVVDLDLLLHRPARLPKRPTGRPHPRMTSPSSGTKMPPEGSWTTKFRASALHQSRRARTWSLQN